MSDSIDVENISIDVENILPLVSLIIFFEG